MSVGDRMGPHFDRTQRKAITAALFTMAFVVFVYGFVTGSFLALASLLAVPFGILLVNNLNWWVVIICGLFYSWLYIPGLPSSLSLFHLFAAGIIPVLAAKLLLSDRRRRRDTILLISVCGYLVVILTTMRFRGFGIRALGGSTWGGAAYIHVLILVVFFLFSNMTRLTKKQWTVAVILFFGAGLIPSAAELLFLLSKGKIWQMYMVVQPEAASAMGSLSAVRQGGGVLRFQVSKYIALLFTMCMAVFPWKGRGKVLIVLSGIIAFAAAGYSGHRSAILYLLLLIPGVMFFRTRRIPFLLLGAYAIGLICLIAFLHFFGSILPLSFQRSVSWIPFADLSHTAVQSASGTMAWRLLVWRQVWELLPDFWLVGRGFAFDSTSYYSLRGSVIGSIEWAVITHNYHSGPLSLLVDLGVFGFFFASMIMIRGAFVHFHLLYRPWTDPALARMYQVILASLCVDLFRFYFVHGGNTSMVSFLLQFVMLEGLHATDCYLASQQAEEVEKNTGDEYEQQGS